MFRYPLVEQDGYCASVSAEKFQAGAGNHGYSWSETVTSPALTTVQPLPCPCPTARPARQWRLRPPTFMRECLFRAR